MRTFRSIEELAACQGETIGHSDWVTITQDAVMTIWNVILGVAVLVWAFGFRAARQMLFHRGKDQPESQTAGP